MNIPSNFRGCAAVWQGGELRFSHAAGYADLANRVPNTLDTRFETASAGKAFVAAGIVHLIAEGRLSLESTLGGLLGFGLGTVEPSVTVAELLCHTSGVPDYFDESVMTDYEELWRELPSYSFRKNRDLFPLILTKPMLYAPGGRFQYNNSGYVLLAAIIEAVTGEAFDDYLQKVVFTPCGMTDTGYFELDMLPARCANSYIYDEARGGYRTNIFSIEAKGNGGGGAFTTLPDVYRFWRGLRGGAVADRALVAEMFRPHGSEFYGYGFWLRDGRPHFEGSDPGVSFISEYDAAGATVIALVSNYGDDVWAILDGLRRELY